MAIRYEEVLPGQQKYLLHDAARTDEVTRISAMMYSSMILSSRKNREKRFAKIQRDMAEKAKLKKPLAPHA